MSVAEQSITVFKNQIWVAGLESQRELFYALCPKSLFLQFKVPPGNVATPPDKACSIVKTKTKSTEPARQDTGISTEQSSSQ